MFCECVPITLNAHSSLQAHDLPVRCMTWSRGDQWMVTGDHGGYIKYWQSNMNNVRMFQGHKEAVRGIRYNTTTTTTTSTDYIHSQSLLILIYSLFILLLFPLPYFPVNICSFLPIRHYWLDFGQLINLMILHF